ncbi:DUF3332 domain-containing protein [Shewanella sp. 3B26]|jgi:hypothetical protein|uniref:DUF3332 domain-containing protein n=1 Tax=Shewanella zhuhaiensis TaxID=2919576 RepID=A0AAJ1BIZ3_9GAMM|nr:DUF3332 domain-containing protein [Shewanella zhuhaiensis]MCH4294644.1 DUF3332 domain-containing protein [Shewanella zhuhaiensis]
MKLNKVTLTLALVASTQLTACMGQMGLSSMLTQGNLSAVDNRYGRAGLYLLLAPVYGLTATADLFIFNSIEFWTGKNPITGKSPALVDMPAKTILKVNDKLDKELTDAPLKGALGANNLKIQDAQFTAIDDNTLAMLVRFSDGSEQTMTGKRSGDKVDFFVDNSFVTSVSIDELSAYAANR